MTRNIAILGINGGFGSRISRSLGEDLFITGIDIGAQHTPGSQCNNYIQSDLTIVDEPLGAVLNKADIIIICLPEDITYKFMSQYRNFFSKDTLFVDTLSVKTEIFNIYEENDLAALSINPMFGPDLPFEGKNILVVPRKTTQAADWFISLLNAWRLNIKYTSAEEHDKITSIMQVAAHSVIIAFGLMLNESDLSLSELSEIGTPPFWVLSALAGRIFAGNKKVYWDIQSENPFAGNIRKRLIENLILLDRAILEGNENEFNKLIEPNGQERKNMFEKLSDYFSSSLTVKPIL